MRHHRAERAARWTGSCICWPPLRLRLPMFQGHGRAGCGRLIPHAGLTIDGVSVTGWCWNCLTAESPDEWESTITV